MAKILSALVCLKQAIVQAKPQERSLKNQIVQAVYPIFPNDKVFNRIVQIFVDPGHDYNKGKYYSRAITGEPICALVQTDKENWLVAMTRSVKVEWPECEFSEEKMIERIFSMMGFGYGGNPYEPRIRVLNFDEAFKKLSKDKPLILRKMECPDFLVFPISDKIVNFKKGFRIQQNGFGHFTNLGNSEYRIRAGHVFTPETLSKLWEVYSAVERDPKLYEKYIKGEIVGEPADHDNPIVRFHATVYNSNGCAGGWGHIPGIAPVDTNGQVYHRETRMEIPSPQQGERLLYKSETPLLNLQRLSLESKSK